MKLFEHYSALSDDIAAAEEMLKDRDESVREMGREEFGSVSYTHLTLPTKA